MLFVGLAGVGVLMVAWTLARWRDGCRDPDPPARLLAALALGVLGALVGLGPWRWIGERFGPWFWAPYGLALLAFGWDVGLEIRARRARGKASRHGSVAAPRERGP
jgi:hypothetical protein